MKEIYINDYNQNCCYKPNQKLKNNNDKLIYYDDLGKNCR